MVGIHLPVYAQVIHPGYTPIIPHPLMPAVWSAWWVQVETGRGPGLSPEINYVREALTRARAPLPVINVMLLRAELLVLPGCINNNDRIANGETPTNPLWLGVSAHSPLSFCSTQRYTLLRGNTGGER